MPRDEWVKLKKNCRDETYVPADAWFEGTLIGKIGIRFKGNVGSLGKCFNKEGEFICRKLSMKMKFDEYKKKNRFYGLKRLNFHAYRWDPTYMKERLSYDLFRAMGIVAPRAAWAGLVVNNEQLGLFGMVEQVDGRFTADRWPEYPDGNLYKEAWPGNTDRNWMTSHLKTNTDPADVSAFLAFSNAMASAKTGELRNTLSRYVDLDYLARYMAVDDGIANFDGITAFYMSPKHEWEGAGNHNYYFYRSAANTFTLIPWDLTSTFGLGGGFTNVPRWTIVPENCGQYYPVWEGDIGVIGPGCDRMFRALAADLGGYRKACREFLDGPFRETAMNEVIDRHAAFIRDEVRADSNGPGVAAFDSAVRAVKKEIPRLRARLESFISDKPLKPVVVDIKEGLSFESCEHHDLATGPLLLSNPNTAASVECNTIFPLSGKHDLLYSFQFADEENAWGQWSFYRIPMAVGDHDVSGLTGIRLLVRADDKRLLRLDLDGPDNPDPMTGIRYGWDIDVPENPTRIEVRFADASLVPWAKKKGKGPQSVVSNVTALIFSPQCQGRNPDGRLGKTKTDKGSVWIDDIAFF